MTFKCKKCEVGDMLPIKSRLGQIVQATDVITESDISQFQLYKCSLCDYTYSKQVVK